MIARISGEVIEKDSNFIVVDANGVGYQIFVSENDLEQIHIGDTVSLSTYFHVREASQELFGFREVEGKQLFEQLISVSGVGPKMALAILSLGEPTAIRGAIAAENTAYISGASGVGKRLAERVCVDLKDKVGMVAGVDVATVGSSDEVVDALVGLGYSKTEAVQAAAKTEQNAPSEDRIKQALSNL